MKLVIGILVGIGAAMILAAPSRALTDRFLVWLFSRGDYGG